MASSKAPKHDFAPAWLKIPDQDNHRPSGAKQAEQSDKNRPGRRDDYYPGFQRYDYPYGPLPRQRSFDTYYEGDRRYGQQKFRHHSVDDEFYGQQYYGYYQNNYNNFEKFGNHYRSQPQLGKYPNNRYGQMNGGFPQPPNFDPYYDYYHNGGGVNPHYNYNNRPNSSKRYNDSRSTGRDKDKENNKESVSSNDTKEKKEEEEFPSLNGETEDNEPKQAVKPNTSSVWEKPTVSKLKIMKGNQQSPKNGSQHTNADKSNKLNNPQIYKTLIPKAPSQKGNRNDGSNSPFNKPVTNGRLAGSSPNDKLNTRLVTTPKNLSDKKSKFLRQLKQSGNEDLSSAVVNGQATSNGVVNGHVENGHSDDKVLENGAKDDCIENGVDDMEICSKMRGFSVEEEQRLLMSWGWRGDDGELTEDELQELHKLSKEIAHLKEQRNGVHVKPTLPKAPWPPIPVIAQESEGELSSSSEDSDLDS